jgi:hypothetical protein
VTKHLYKVTLNWHGEVHVLFTHSPKEASALRNAVRKLARYLTVDYSYVRRLYLGDKDNFKVERWGEKNDIAR